jgi:hypothetical protein
VVVTFLAVTLGTSPSWADDEQPLSQAPGPGDTTSSTLPFSVPVSFSAAVAEAATYPDAVVAIRYDNPEMTGEYSFGSGVTPAAFEADFLAQYGTTPAATALIVETILPEPEDSQALAARGNITHREITVDAPAFVPPPAVFDETVEALFSPQTSTIPTSRVQTSLPGPPTDWRVSQAQYEITDYTSNRVSFVSSFWWLGPNAPNKVPAGFGVEFEVNMYGSYNVGSRPNCRQVAIPGTMDPEYKKRQAAVNENWNWRVIRPDGLTAPSSLGAYADYNDLSDDCRRSSFAIGLRYPQNIQYVNGAYGVLIVIDAPKGYSAMSEVGAVNQVVSDSFCATTLGYLMSLTDCMGVSAGVWLSIYGPKAQTTLNIANHEFLAPRKCWLTDFTQHIDGDVYDNTAWACP